MPPLVPCGVSCSMPVHMGLRLSEFLRQGFNVLLVLLCLHDTRMSMHALRVT